MKDNVEAMNYQIGSGAQQNKDFNGVPLEERGFIELRVRAKFLKIKYYYKMTKCELVDAIRKENGNFDETTKSDKCMQRAKVRSAPAKTKKDGQVNNKNKKK